MSQKSETAPRLSRSRLIRDTAVFQFKLLLDGIIDLVLAPVTLVAAVISFVTGSDLFYRAVRAGWRYDRRLNLFGAARSYRSDTNDQLDRLALRIEDEIRREMKDGHLRAGAKAGLERIVERLRERAEAREGK